MWGPCLLGAGPAREIGAQLTDWGYAGRRGDTDKKTGSEMSVYFL